uniref:Oxidoreductase n=1 Tax=Panagrellus redivivus TaxID=6233 RepID=A0A7E4W7K0_PANRE
MNRPLATCQSPIACRVEPAACRQCEWGYNTDVGVCSMDFVRGRKGPEGDVQEAAYRRRMHAKQQTCRRNFV